MGVIKTYDPKKVVIALGNHMVTGYADDSFLTIEHNGDGIVHKVGCCGEIARAITPDDTSKIKLSLLQMSDTNSFLQNAYNGDRKTGEGMFSILIKDLRGGVVFQSEACWVIKSTSRGFGKDTNSREWELNTGSSTSEET